MDPFLAKNIQPEISRLLNVESDGHCGFRAVSWCLGCGQGDYMGIWEELIKEITNRRESYEEQQIFHRIDKVLEQISVDSPKPCPQAKWMSMPAVGDAMANSFQCPVFFFSATWSQTFFPYFFPPNNNPPIFFALISSVSHFVSLQLKSSVLFPAPQLLKDWEQNALPEALGWKARYESCFQMTAGRKLLFPTTLY